MLEISNTCTVAAALEKPTLQSLRSFQHTDTNGNPIGKSLLHGIFVRRGHRSWCDGS
jgi:hypothetical protein